MPPNFATCSVVTVIYKIGSEIWGAPPPKNLAAQKRQNFGATSGLNRQYLRNATRYHQSENGVANYNHSRTRQLNLVNFGPQTAKNRTGVSTHSKSTFLDTHILGAKGQRSLKLSQVRENREGLLMHTLPGMGLPQQFFTD